jgi:hypothetical protein
VSIFIEITLIFSKNFVKEITIDVLPWQQQKKNKKRENEYLLITSNTIFIFTSKEKKIKTNETLRA